jgi:hypothetical protein
VVKLVCNREDKMRRSIPLALGLVFFCAPAFADPRQDVLGAAARCNAFTDTRTWLDCYYGAAQPLRALLGLAPAPAGQVKLVPPAMPGSAPAQKVPVLQHNPSSNDDDTRTQLMASYSFDADGRFTVTLADGETWKQVYDDSLQARWKGPAGNYRASVVTSMFGTHMLRVSDGHAYRVARPH